MLNISFGGRASRKRLSLQTIWGLIPCPFLVYKVLLFLGVDLPGPRGCLVSVCGGEVVPEQTEEPLSCRDLLLSFKAWCWELPLAF